MGKDKKRNDDVKELEQTTFYYELIGLIFIIFSITILGKLGTLGIFFTVIFKVIFGDWYWIFILFLLFFGFMNLFKHKKFNFKNQRFIGYVFICFGLLMFAHFPLHNYIKTLKNPYFSEAWNIYRSFIETGQSSYLGGGMIGALMFYAVFYLFGSFGVILIALLIMLFGMSLIINKSVIEILKSFGSGTKSIKYYTKKFNDFFKYRLGSTKVDKQDKSVNIFSKNIQVPLKILEEYQNVMNYNFQEKLCLETRSLIHSVFSNLHIEYRDIDFLISFKITTYKFTLYSEYKLNNLIDRLKNVIDEDLLIGQDSSSLIIQIINKYPQVLTIRELLMRQNSLYNNYILALGLTYENKLVETDLCNQGNLLLIGSINSGIKNFINYYIFSLFVKTSLTNYDIEIFDNNKELESLYNLINPSKEEDVNAFLNTVIKDIDDRLKLINEAKVTSIDDYNKKIEIDNDNKAILKRKFIIINCLKVDKETYSYFENKLMYVTQLGEKAGVVCLYSIREAEYATSIIMSLFTHKLVFKLDSVIFSNKIMNNDNASFLQEQGDAFYLSQVKARRIQTALCSKRDLESVSDYLLK